MRDRPSLVGEAEARVPAGCADRARWSCPVVRHPTLQPGPAPRGDRTGLTQELRRVPGTVHARDSASRGFSMT